MNMKMRPLWVLLLLLLAGCQAAAGEPTATPTLEPEAVFTAAAQTAEARTTEQAALTPTSLPSATPSQTPQPTTPTPTQTTIAATNTPFFATGGNDMLEFVADVTVPDGTNFKPGERFTKTWRVKNAGTSTWTTAYALVFASGASMNGPAAVPVPLEVLPGAIVDLSVDLTAPADPGSYTGNWLLRNAAGANFGLGPEAKWPIYVEINVQGSTTPGTPGATVTSASGGKAVSAVALSVDEATVEDTCPYTFNFTGEITLNQASTVTYQLEAETGFPITLPDPITASLGAGTYFVPYALEFTGSLEGVARLHVTAPNDVLSGPVNFTLKCN
ncbi:MAG: hypothetical protein JSV61_03065 [Anaerolineales bacterium]|nr:MAG: hypothetical protein JSV61_03065 [Anaerolineales bacterium]